MKIRRESNITLYMQIADRLAREITSGRYKAFQRLPTEHDLMARYRVSRITVRQAIAQLIRQELVVSKQGKGTFVAGPVVQHALEELKGFYDTLIGQGHAPQTQLLEFGPKETPADIGLLLGASVKHAVYLKRIYSLQGRPFALARAWLPPAAQRVAWDEATLNPLYAILQNLLSLKVERAEVSIIARQAETEESDLLKLKPASPLLVMERTSYSHAGEALEISRFSILPEHYRFRLSVQGPLAITRQIQEVPARVRSRKLPAKSTKRTRNP